MVRLGGRVQVAKDNFTDYGFLMLIKIEIGPC